MCEVAARFIMQTLELHALLLHGAMHGSNSLICFNKASTAAGEDGDDNTAGQTPTGDGSEGGDNSSGDEGDDTDCDKPGNGEGHAYGVCDEEPEHFGGGEDGKGNGDPVFKGKK